MLPSLSKPSGIPPVTGAHCRPGAPKQIDVGSRDTLMRRLWKEWITSWGLNAAGSEYSLGVLSYNLMRAINVLGVKDMLARLA